VKEDFDKILQSLNDEEKKVLKYFITYRSVGEILAVRELMGLYKVRDPAKIIGRLIELRLLSRGIGCYNISKEFLEYLRRKGRVEIK